MHFHYLYWLGWSTPLLVQTLCIFTGGHIAVCTHAEGESWGSYPQRVQHGWKAGCSHKPWRCVCVCVVLYLHVTLYVSNGRLPNQKWKVTLWWTVQRAKVSRPWVIPCHHSAVVAVLSKQYRFVDILNHKLVIIRPLQEKCPSLSLLPRISLLSIFWACFQWALSLNVFLNLYTLYH